MYIRGVYISGNTVILVILLILKAESRTQILPVVSQWVSLNSIDFIGNFLAVLGCLVVLHPSTHPYMSPIKDIQGVIWGYIRMSLYVPKKLYSGITVCPLRVYIGNSLCVPHAFPVCP